MTNKFLNSLTLVLDSLGKKGWFEPLHELQLKFQQIPDQDFNFESELLDMLHGLRDITDNDPALPIGVIAAIRLANLNCWYFRFRQDLEYLNPLTTDLSVFLNNPDIKVSYAAAAFPAPDLVKRWAREHLN